MHQIRMVHRMKRIIYLPFSLWFLFHVPFCLLFGMYFFCLLNAYYTLSKRIMRPNKRARMKQYTQILISLSA